jgi:hypothetical protein
MSSNKLNPVNFRINRFSFRKKLIIKRSVDNKSHCTHELSTLGPQPYLIFFFSSMTPDAHSKRPCSASSNAATPHAPGSSPQLHPSGSPLAFIWHFMHFSNNSLPFSPSLSNTLCELLSISLSFGKGLAQRHVLSCDVRRSRVHHWQGVPFACGVTKSTDAHWEYVILIAFPPQQWLPERSSMLCLYLHCLFGYNKTALVDNIYDIRDITDNKMDGIRSISKVLTKTRKRRIYAVTEIAVRACLRIRPILPRHPFECKAPKKDLDLYRSALCCCYWSVMLCHPPSSLRPSNG